MPRICLQDSESFAEAKAIGARKAIVTNRSWAKSQRRGDVSY